RPDHRLARGQRRVRVDRRPQERLGHRRQDVRRAQGPRDGVTDLRLLVPAAVAWIAAAVVVGVPDWRIAVALWAAAGVATVVALRRGPAAIAALALAAAACCCTSIAV